MLDIVQRYYPIVKTIRSFLPSPGTILEVGGSGDGLGHYLPKYQITDADIFFVKKSPANTKRVILSKKMVKLPFPDQSFPVVVSIDMLEHLSSPQKQAKMIKEMLRVCQKLLIMAVPTGQQSLEAVSKLKEYRQKKYPVIKDKYIEEHLKFGHPEKKGIMEMIKKTGFKIKIVTRANANIAAWLLFQKFYINLPCLGRVFRYRLFWLKLLTPFWPLFNRRPAIRTIFIIKKLS